MANFAVITLIIISLSLTHLYNWICRVLFNNPPNGESALGIIILMGCIWLALEIIIMVTIVGWAPESFLCK